MATLGELIVKIGADARGLTGGLNDSTKQLNKWSKQAEKGIGPIMDGIGRGIMIVGAAAAAGFGALVAGSVSGASSLEQYRNTLNIVMKDQEKAAEMMAWAVDFADYTPFNTDKVVEATVKLQSYGLEAQKVLPAVGDMAAVMNKDLIQAVEAVADAQTGELERLKEFGITKAMIVEQGNKIMQGVQIVNNKGQITDQENFNKALFSLMNERFAGGMAAQAKTFSGLMSTLKGKFSTTLATMAGISKTGEVQIGGLFDNIRQKVQLMVDKLMEWQESGQLQEWADKAQKALSVFWNVGEKVFNGIIAVGKWIIDNWGLIGPILAGVLAGFLAYRTAQGVIAALTLAQNALNMSMKMNPIGYLVLAIGVLVTAGVLLYKNWDTIKAKANALWTAIKTAFNSIKAKVLEVAKNAIQWGKDIVDGLIAGIKQKIDSVKNIVSELANTIISKIESVLDMHSPSKVMAEVGENIAAGLIVGMRKASADVRNSAMELVNGMLGSVKQITDQFNQSVTQAMETFRQQEEQLTQQYQQQLDSRTQSLYSWISIFDEVPEKMKVTGAQLLENLKGQVQYFTAWQTGIADLSKKAVDEGLIKELQEMGPKALPQIEALASMTDTELASYVSLWQEKHQLAKEQSTNELTGLKTETWNKIEELRANTNKQLAQYAVDFLKKIGEVKTESLARLGEMATKGVTIGSDLITNIIQGVVNKKEDLRRQIQDVADMMSFLPTVGNGLPYVQPYVPALAAGGIVTRPTLAMIGEAGPEAVIPLSRGGGAGATTNHITVNINGAQNPDAVFRELERRLARAGVRW